MTPVRPLSRAEEREALLSGLLSINAYRQGLHRSPEEATYLRRHLSDIRTRREAVEAFLANEVIEVTAQKVPEYPRYPRANPGSVMVTSAEHNAWAERFDTFLQATIEARLKERERRERLSGNAYLRLPH